MHFATSIFAILLIGNVAIFTAVNANEGIQYSAEGIGLIQTHEQLKRAQEKRSKQLGYVLDRQGDLQGYDVLKYEEASFYEHNLGWPVAKEPFMEAYGSLHEKAVKFGELQPMLKKWMNPNVVMQALIKEANAEPTMHQMFTEKRKNGEHFHQILYNVRRQKLWHSFVIDCKLFMRKLFSEPKINFTSSKNNDEQKKFDPQEVFSEGGEASYINIFTYMRQGIAQKDAEYQIILENIWAIAKMHGNDLEQLTLAQIYAEHLVAKEAKSNGPAAYKRALVVGGGPIGMYSALQMFMAGMEVTLVNDRPERYTRKQILYLDPKWMVQLRFFLGKSFHELFVDWEKAVGQIYPGETGELKCRELEIALKERMADLINFTQHQEKLAGRLYDTKSAKKNDENQVALEGPLQILFEAEFVKVKDANIDGKPEFLAELATPEMKTNQDQKEFNENLIRNKMKKFTAKGYNQNDAREMAIEKFVDANTRRIQMYMKKPENVDGESDFDDEGFWDAPEEFPKPIAEPMMKFRRGRHMPEEKITLSERAELELNGQALALRRLPEVPFDVLVCAGGANDRVRDQILGKPKVVLSMSYGVAVLEKAIPNLYIFGSNASAQFFEFGIQGMMPQIKKQEFEYFVKNSGPFKEKYAHFNQLLVNGMNANKAKKMQSIRIWETRSSIYLAASTPQPMVALFKDLDGEKSRRIQKLANELNEKSTQLEGEELLKIQKEIGQKIQKIIENFTAFRQQMERKWFSALYEYSLTRRQFEGQSNVQLNLDEAGRITQTLDEWKRSPQNYQKLFFDAQNTSTFPLDIKLAENSFKELSGGKLVKGARSLVIALGDALASPHFMTGSGLSSGRLGVENVVRLLKEYDERKIGGKKLFQAKLRAAMNDVKERVRKKAVDFESKRKNDNRQ